MGSDDTTVRALRRKRAGPDAPTLIERGTPRGTRPTWVVRSTGDAAEPFSASLHMLDANGVVCSTPSSRRFKTLPAARKWVATLAAASKRTPACRPRVATDDPDVVEVWA